MVGATVESIIVFEVARSWVADVTKCRLRDAREPRCRACADLGHAHAIDCTGQNMNTAPCAI
jgi:hypothetical protein